MGKKFIRRFRLALHFRQCSLCDLNGVIASQSLACRSTQPVARQNRSACHRRCSPIRIITGHHPFASSTGL